MRGIKYISEEVYMHFPHMGYGAPLNSKVELKYICFIFINIYPQT